MTKDFQIYKSIILYFFLGGQEDGKRGGGRGSRGVEGERRQEGDTLNRINNLCDTCVLILYLYTEYKLFYDRYLNSSFSISAYICINVMLDELVHAYS